MNLKTIIKTCNLHKEKCSKKEGSKWKYVKIGPEALEI